MSKSSTTSTTLTKEEVDWWRKAFENSTTINTGTTITTGAYTPNVYQEISALAQRVKKLEEDIPRMIEAFLKAIEEVKNESK